MLSTLVLMVIGVLFIYSSGVTSSGVALSNEYLKQIIWVALGLAIMVAFVLTNYYRIGEFSIYIYLAFLCLLVFTLFFGKVVNGARSWIPIFAFGFQPSEFAKVATILYLAHYFEGIRPGTNDIQRFSVAFFIVLVPMILILLQPDMGTALVFIPIFLIMSYIAGIKSRYVAFSFLAGALLIFLSVLPAWEEYIAGTESIVVDILSSPSYSSYILGMLGVIIGLSSIGYYMWRRKYFYWLIYSFAIVLGSYGGSFVFRALLKDYQIKRLIVFLKPGIDPQGAGWNVIQSVTAVGSGGLLGKGWLNGTQSHYRYLPQQSTDFIFSIIAEEWGFIGSVFIFVLFMVIIFRGLVIVMSARDDYASYVAGGVVGMIAFHIFINIGMAMGIMPITGIPLFFLSYGGSSLWTALIGIGLLLSIHIRRYRY
ncbi:MAG: rod shape-determining protein RodA [Spirochaetales bacterium]|nr:rod shape-determining protein RodA [Spirochaetales bacterium]